MSSRFLFRVAVVLLSTALLFTSTLGAQTFYGSIVGTVTDPTGSVVPGATVTLTNNSTGEHRTGTTGADGAYRFVNLVPGLYKVGSEFLRVPALHARSDPGERGYGCSRGCGHATWQRGTDRGGSRDVPVLQTETSSVGSVVSTRAVESLPLNGRNVLNLVALSPAWYRRVAQKAA